MSNRTMYERIHHDGPFPPGDLDSQTWATYEPIAVNDLPEVRELQEKYDALYDEASKGFTERNAARAEVEALKGLLYEMQHKMRDYNADLWQRVDAALKGEPVAHEHRWVIPVLDAIVDLWLEKPNEEGTCTTRLSALHCAVSGCTATPESKS